jgi:hypothetical protein
MPKHRFVVEVNSAMTWTDTRDFVLDAVSTWGGQYFPGDDEQNADPRFDIKSKDVKVMRQWRGTKPTK